MLLFKKDNYTIFFEEKDKVFMCYKGNSFHRLLPYHKTVKTIFQLKDDARAWFEEWIDNKPKPNNIIANEDAALKLGSFKNSLYTIDL